MIEVVRELPGRGHARRAIERRALRELERKAQVPGLGNTPVGGMLSGGSVLTSLGILPTDSSISTSSSVISHHEPRAGFMATTGTGVPGDRITSLTSLDPNAHIFAEVSGSGPILRYDSLYRVYYAEYAGAHFLLNSGTWANTVVGGTPHPCAHHALIRVDDLPNTNGSAIMGACNHTNNNSYLQQVITHPASGVDNYKVSRKGSTGANATVTFTSPSRNQLLNLWTVYDGTNTSWYCEGVRLDTLAHTNASSSPTRGVMGALFLSGTASAFATMSAYFDTWYSIAPTIAQMREVDDAYTQPRFRTRGNVTSGELIVIGADGYQQSTSHCATWRTPLRTVGGIVYSITRINQNSRNVVRQRPVASRTWEGAGGDTPPTANRDSTRDGHDNESLGVAGDGTLHYAFDMHGVPQQYGSSTTGTIAANGIKATGFGNFLPYSFSYASSALRLADATLVAGDVGKMARQTSDDSSWILLTPSPSPTWAPTFGELACTYPAFVKRNNGDLYCFERDGRSGQGLMVVMKYDATTGARTHVATIFDEGSGPDPYSFYWQLFYDTARDVFWLSGCCRHGASAGVESNEGVYCFKSTDGFATIKDVSGGALTMPLSNATAPKIVNVPFAHELINQQTMCVDPSTGFPVVLMHWAPSMGGVIDLHCVFWNGSTWTDRALGVLTQAFTYGAPAATAGNAGGAIAATTGAVIGRGGSIGYAGVLYYWGCASQWGNGVFEITLPFSNLASGTVTRTQIIGDDAFKPLASNVLWATWEGMTPDYGRLDSDGVVSFTFQRGAFESPTTTAQSFAWPAQPIFEYNRTLPGSPAPP